MTGKKRFTRSSGDGSSGYGYNSRSDYMGSPWLSSNSGGFNQTAPMYNQPFANDYNSTSNFGGTGFSGGNTYGRGYKDPDSILKELGKCYLSSLSSGGGSSSGNGYGGGPSYGRYGNATNQRSFVQRYNNNSKRSWESNSSNVSATNSNKKKQKMNNKPSEAKSTTAKANGNATPAKKEKEATAVKANNETAETSAAKNKANKKRKQTNKMVKLRYHALAQNTFLDENARVVVGYLKQVVHELVNTDKIHYSLTASFMTGHRNAIKLYQHELKTLLDKKFGGDNTSEEVKKSKRDYLVQLKDRVIEEQKVVFESSTEEATAAREKLIDDVIDTLTADEFPTKLIPTVEEYVLDPAGDNSPAAMLREFQYKFLLYTYEEFGYTLLANKAPVKNNIKFHNSNRFIAALVLEIVTSGGTLKQGDSIDLPDVLKTRLDRKYNRKPFLRTKTEKSSRVILAYQVKAGATVETNMIDLLKGADASRLKTKQIRDLADAILLFDEISSVVKYKLLGYTPYLTLPLKEKAAEVNRLVAAVYKDVLEVLITAPPPLAERSFEPLEGEPPAPAAEEKETNGKPDEAMDTA